MKNLVVLPGLGATAEMYQGAWREDPSHDFLDWPKNSGITTMDQLAQWVCDQRPDADMFIGSSLGGMIALLCASRMKHRHVVLIGSATRFDEVSPLIQKLHVLSNVMPFELAKLLSGSVPLQLAQMYAEQDADLMKCILLDMPGFHWVDEPVRVLRIHGEHDSIIECPQDADLKLNGGHLIAISHAKEICDWLHGAKARP